MSATVHEGRSHIGALGSGIRYAYEGDYNGYYALCDECSAIGGFHAIGLEPAPKAAALTDADLHNEDRHA